MIFCNIWLKDHIPKNRQRSIDSFKSLMLPNDQYLFIDNDDIYQEALKKHSNWWRVYSERDNKFKADFIRLYLACIYPDLFYSDTDILFGNFFKLNNIKNLPNIAQWGCTSEICLFYVNNNCNFFKNMMNYIERFNPKICFLPFALSDFFRKNRHIRINHETFSHQRLGNYKKCQ